MAFELERASARRRAFDGIAAVAGRSCIFMNSGQNREKPLLPHNGNQVHAAVVAVFDTANVHRHLSPCTPLSKLVPTTIEKLVGRVVGAREHVQILERLPSP